MTDELFADEKRKLAELFRQFDRLPTTWIVGAVNAIGVGGGKIGQERMWTIRIELLAWKPDGGALQQSVLSVRQRVSHKEMVKLNEQVDAESVYRMLVKIAHENPFGSPQALLVELQGPADDPEVMNALRDYEKPVTISDARFGTLTLDKGLGWFQGGAEWCGHRVNFAASAETPQEAAPAIETAHRLWEHTQEWHDRVTRYAADELVSLKNESWLREDEQAASAEEFIRRMAIQSITVYPDGDFEFWFKDGELFWGHSILVSGTLTEGLQSADIAG